MRLTALLTALALCLAGLAGFAAATSAAPAAQAPRASLPDIEDEVMCTICGTTLQLANSPQAEQERDLINSLIARGRTKEQIKDALVAEYGSEVLAVPSSSGFDIAAWVVPVVGILLAVIGVAAAARRWRAAQEARPAAGSGAEAEAGDAERLDADLARYET